MLLTILMIGSSASGEHTYEDLKNVPIDRLIANIMAKLEKYPRYHRNRYELARLHSMAYAGAATATETTARGVLIGASFTEGETLHVSPKVERSSSDPALEEKRKNHLEEAIKQYEEAVKLAPKHWPSVLGLAWCEDQAGNQEEAKKGYRAALELTWEDEKDGPHFTHSIIATPEIANYLIKLLDPERDGREIVLLQARVKTVNENKDNPPRAVSPILIPLTDETRFEHLIDTSAQIEFDLDGSGLVRKWQWINPNAGWLVFDAKGNGKITSGLQMLGNVTFWIFWDDGYQALSALDADDDGEVRGAELEGLAIWRDSNSNGISEPGEVRSVGDWGIRALSTRAQTHPTGIPYNPRGVLYEDGRTRPSYDWIVRSEN